VVRCSKPKSCNSSVDVDDDADVQVAIVLAGRDCSKTAEDELKSAGDIVVKSPIFDTVLVCSGWV